MTVVLTGHDLTLGELVRVARDVEAVELAPEIGARMQAARGVVEAAAAGADEVYGRETCGGGE